MMLTDLETPALILDSDKLARNCRRLRDRLTGLGARLRPHMKTLKCVEAAPMARGPGHGGIAVATLNEAAYFADQGYDDIQLAVCLPPTKLGRAAAVLAQAPRFSFFLDSLAMADAVAAFSRAHGARFNIWIEVDSGE